MLPGVAGGERERENLVRLYALRSSHRGLRNPRFTFVEEDLLTRSSSRLSSRVLVETDASGNTRDVHTFKMLHVGDE